MTVRYEEREKTIKALFAIIDCAHCRVEVEMNRSDKGWQPPDGWRWVPQLGCVWPDCYWWCPECVDRALADITPRNGVF